MQAGARAADLPGNQRQIDQAQIESDRVVEEERIVKDKLLREQEIAKQRAIESAEIEKLKTKRQFNVVWRWQELNGSPKTTICLTS